MDKPQIETAKFSKDLLTSTSVLKFYNPNSATRIRTDASSEVGTMLEQNIEGEWYPIAFASRSLRSNERNYAQIEKETTCR